MARWKKEKQERRKRNRDIISVPLKPLKYESDEVFAVQGVTCDWCGARCEDAPDEDEWLLGAGVTEDGFLAIARYCPDCFHNKIEWGRVYCPGGFGNPTFPLGVE